MRRLDEEQKERVMHAREKMAAALKDVNNHIEQNKAKSFCSCGSDQCGHSCCGKPLGKQARGYMCCSSRHYDRIDEEHLGEARHMAWAGKGWRARSGAGLAQVWGPVCGIRVAGWGPWTGNS